MQLKLVKLIFENLGNTKNTKSMAELMRLSGYSKSQCDNPKQILDTIFVKEALTDFVSKLEDKRSMAITKLTEEKMDIASAKDTASIIDILTKNIQLLGNKPTEITKHQLSEEEQSEIDELLD